MNKTLNIFFIVIMCINLNAGFLEKPIIYIVKKFSTKTLSEGTETAIKISCRETTETAMKLAAKYGDDAGRFFAKYGDDAVRITARYGDDAVKLFSKYGDDLMKISGKYGDDGARVFIKYHKQLKPLMTKYGDDIIKPYIEHPGLGDRLVKEFGEDAIKISSKMDDEAAIVVLKKAEKVNKRSLVNKILFHKNGKINKAGMLTLIGGSAVAGGMIYHKIGKFFHLTFETIQPIHWISLSVLLLIICIYIVMKIELNKKQKVKEVK